MFLLQVRGEIYYEERDSSGYPPHDHCVSHFDTQQVLTRCKKCVHVDGCLLMLLSLYVHNILISNIIIIIIIIHFRTTVYNALSVSLSFCLLQ